MKKKPVLPIIFTILSSICFIIFASGLITMLCLKYAQGGAIIGNILISMYLMGVFGPIFLVLLVLTIVFWVLEKKKSK